MSFVTPTTVSTGCLISAATWNQNVVNNVIQMASSPLTYDFVNDRIGINFATPVYALDVSGNLSSSAATAARFRGGATGNNNTVIRLFGGSANIDLWSLASDGVFGNGQNYFGIFDLINGLQRLEITASGAVLINPVNGASNTGNTKGLTIQQGAATNEIFSFKNTGVAHGMTTLTETDTIMFAQIVSSASGGIKFHGIGSQTGGTPTPAFSILGEATNGTNTSAATGNFGAVNIRGDTRSGTTQANLSASNFILSLQTGALSRFFFREDGTSYEHVGTAWTNFDEHDDVALLNLAAAHLSRDPIRENFGAWLKQNREPLQRLDLVTFDDENGHFVNRSRMQELLIGAVRQMADKNRALESRLTQVERLLSPPGKDTA